MHDKDNIMVNCVPSEDSEQAEYRSISLLCAQRGPQTHGFLMRIAKDFLMQTSKNAQSYLSFCSGAHIMCLFSTGTHT